MNYRKTLDLRITEVIESEECPKCKRYLERRTIPSQTFEYKGEVFAITPVREYVVCKCGYSSEFESFVDIDTGLIWVELEDKNNE